MVSSPDYSSYPRWTANSEDWLRVSLIAAPFMILFGLVLITYRLCGRRALYIYKPPTQTTQCHSGVYEPVYKTTTCAVGDGATVEHA